ncbi:MAG: glutamate 5-kinase [Firmicutes bacterium]|nr:glutamate 5-kinase [Bacillota bacterium]
MQNTLKSLNQIVIKIGSSSLTHESGLIDLWKMESLVKQIANLFNSGKDVIVVSSGAIAAGIGKMKLTEKPKAMPEKQAAAAVGQSTLMHMYEKFFSEYGITVAQVLLTKEDMYEESRRAHCVNALSALINHRIIPIINENDVVAIDEIKVGDNDTLSAEVCKMINFDNLIILSDINGVYNKDPRKHPDAEMIPLIDRLEILDAIDAGDAGSTVGTGGMQTKFKAARIIASTSKTMFIINSGQKDVLNRMFSGESFGTFFDFRNL